MDDTEYFKNYECKKTELYIRPKKETIPKFLGRKEGFFSRVVFLNSTFGLLKFMILLGEKTLKQLAKPKKRPMGCVVEMNTDLIGQNYFCPDQDPHSKEKKTKKDCLIFHKMF